MAGNWTNNEDLAGRGLRLITDKGKSGIVQSQLWKELELNSRDGSRLAISLEKRSLIKRVRFFENGRWTYRLLPTKLPISLECIESAPCLSCPVEHMCSIDSSYNPQNCNLVENWITMSFEARTQITEKLEKGQPYRKQIQKQSNKSSKRRVLVRVPKDNLKPKKIQTSHQRR
ncbi:MAG: transcriptional regulator [Thermoproteota archaeon]|nr:transcriptional regulator [Thermoproteota archaeon]